MGRSKQQRQQRHSDDISRAYEEHGPKLKQFIAKRVRWKEDAEDIMQDVFHALARVDADDQPLRSISSWLYSVALNKITDRYRKKKEQRLSPVPSGDDDGFIRDLGYFLTSDSSDPESEYLRGLVWEELQAALDELPAEQRTVFELSEIEGFSFKEISESTGIGVNTLLSRKRYAVLHLRQRMRFIYDDINERGGG